jgi:hypothetical protein
MRVRSRRSSLGVGPRVVRSILANPPADWDYERKQQYFAWKLKAEFESAWKRFDEIAE